MASVDIEEEFPILRDQIFFNHAAVAPIPTRTARALEHWIGQAQTSVATDWPEWAAALRRARTNAAALVGAGTGDIAFVHNTTHGLLIIANSLPWRPGDNVVIAEHEFPANAYPWMNLASKGVAVRIAPERDGKFLVEDFAALIDERTRLVSISLVQYSTGFRMPAEEIAAICREKESLFCLDAIQAVGVQPVDVEALGCDFLVADGHKWLLSPEGFGIFYARDRARAQMSDAMTGWAGRSVPGDYDNWEQPLSKTAKRFEEGSHAMALAVALEQSTGLLLEVGIEEVWRKIEANTARLCTGLGQLGFEVRSSRADGQRSGIIAFSKGGIDPPDVVEALADRQITIAKRRGWMRASPHFYNTGEQIDRFLKALEEVERSLRR